MGFGPICERKAMAVAKAAKDASSQAVQAHMKQGLPLAPGMEIAYVVKDARKWEVGSSKNEQHPS
jgi:hypothetical protein